jgi:hypothetical protein
MVVIAQSSFPMELKRNQTIAHCLWRSDVEEADQRLRWLLRLCYDRPTGQRAPPHQPPAAKDQYDQSKVARSANRPV